MLPVQDLVVGLAALAAGGYVARRIWRGLRPAPDGAACPSCGPAEAACGHAARQPAPRAGARPVTFLRSRPR